MTQVRRYHGWWWEPSHDECVCDRIIVDRTTGKAVVRYDAADPANTKYDYGGMSDRTRFLRRGLDYDEVIDESEAVWAPTPENLKAFER